MFEADMNYDDEKKSYCINEYILLFGFKVNNLFQRWSQILYILLTFRNDP